MSNIYIQEPPTSGKVVMRTTAGDIEIELWTREAPKACRNFIQLCMEGYYNNTIFHRIVKGFICQGGDPTGTGEGGESIYGETFKDEFHSRLRFCRRGLVAMANAGKNDNGSQFFFTLAATPELQNKHTIFGKIAGDTIYNVVKLEDALVDEHDRPVYEQKILKTEVITNPFEDIVPRTVSKKKTDEGKGKKKKKGVKDFKLLSFGGEAEEDEEISTVLSKELSGKSKSAHDNLADPKLSAQPVTDLDSSPPPSKKKRLEEDETSPEERLKAEKEKQEMTERVRNKLKGAKRSSEPTKEIIESKDKDEDEESEEEYYLGKDKVDERKKKTEEIKKQIRDLKRGIRDDKNKKLDDQKKEAEDEKKKEAKSEMTKQYLDTQEKYKKEKSKVPLKGASRDEFTQQLLAKFKNKLHTAREKCPNEEDIKSDPDQEEDKNDPNDITWLAGTLKCEDKGPILAKDASTKDDDWFEIYDPRNPINKRRRGETGEKKPRDDRRNRR